MNNKKLLNFLISKKIKFINLSSTSNFDLKDKDIDIYVPLKEKYKFEKIISTIKILKRNQLAKLYFNRFFYYSDLIDENPILDVSYEIIFFKNRFLFYKFKYSDKLINLKYKKKYNNNTDYELMLFVIFLARNLWNKKKDNKGIVKILNYKKNIKFLKKINLRTNSSNKDVGLALNPFFEKKFTLNNIRSKNEDNNYILFLGADGVGKTTIIEYLQKRMKSKTHAAYYGISGSKWKYKINYLFYDVFKNNIRLGSLFLLIDIILKNISLRANVRNSFVLIDRFPGFLYLKKFFLFDLIKSFLPKPDLIILLKLKSSIRKSRKPLEYVKNDTKWKVVAKKMALPLFEINVTNKSKEVIYKKIIKKIYSKNIFYNKVLS
tara:strand:+ start:847 stop:1977 length:1131 start_codon:yes stop_codon:yes gene_type:complete